MFALHVLGMSAAFLAAGPLGAVVKKLPGNTSFHAACMIVGTFNDGRVHPLMLACHDGIAVPCVRLLTS